MAKSLLQTASRRLARQSAKVKGALGAVAALVALIVFWFLIEDHATLFVVSEVVHAIGILVLIYKLHREKNCAGLSLRSQELTAIFLMARLYCSTHMEYNVHTILDSASLFVTLWVIYMIRMKLKQTYSKDLDNMPIYYIIIPCALLAALVYPQINYPTISRMLWAFSVYLEAVSVLPQLLVLQKIKLVEPFTAFYVFALGISRFVSCAHWLLQIVNGRGYLYNTIGTQIKNRSLLSYGFWPVLVVLAEIVHTFILADFCYYYAKSVTEGERMFRLPSTVV